MLCGVKTIHSLTKTTKIRGRLCFSTLFFLAFFGFLLKNPSLASDSVRRALLLCAEGLIPSLFPMAVLNGILLRSPFPYYVSRLSEKPMQFLFAMDGICAFPLLTGCLSGFPLGIKNTASLYRDGLLDRNQALRLICFSNNVSPAFALFAVGIGFFGSLPIGVLLYGCQLISALVIGFALSFPRKKATSRHSVPPRLTCPDAPLSAAISGAVAEAGMTTVTLCAFTVFFRLLCDMLLAVLSPLGLPQPVTALLAGSIEITRGVAETASCHSDGIPIGIPVASLLLGWSSLSVHMQAAAFLLPEGLTLKGYLAAKSVQAILSFLTAFLFLTAFS